jgi:hypothetical protein
MALGIDAQVAGKVVLRAGIGGDGAVGAAGTVGVEHAERRVGQPFAPIGRTVLLQAVRIGDKGHAHQQRVAFAYPPVAEGAQPLRMHNVVGSAAHRARNHATELPRVPGIVDLPPQDGVWAQVRRGVVVAQKDHRFDAGQLGELLGRARALRGRTRFRFGVLYIQRESHAQAGQMRHKMEYMPFDAAETMQREHHPCKHSDANWIGYVRAHNTT